jgi:hypothetical protein
VLLVPPGLDKHIEHFALGVGAAQVGGAQVRAAQVDVASECRYLCGQWQRSAGRQGLLN